MCSLVYAAVQERVSDEKEWSEWRLRARGEHEDQVYADVPMPVEPEGTEMVQTPYGPVPKHLADQFFANEDDAEVVNDDNAQVTP